MYLQVSINNISKILALCTSKAKLYGNSLMVLFKNRSSVLKVQIKFQRIEILKKIILKQLWFGIKVKTLIQYIWNKFDIHGSNYTERNLFRINISLNNSTSMRFHRRIRTSLVKNQFEQFWTTTKGAAKIPKLTN